MALVSVVILTWNSAENLPVLAVALAAQTHRDCEIIVVDNGSADSSVALAQEFFPACTVVCNPSNFGFAKACNQGIDASRGEYVLLLNHDVQLDPRFIEVLAAVLETRPEVGWCSGKLLRPADAGGGIRIDSAGEVIKRNRRVVNRGEGEVDRGQFDRPEPVFGVSAAAALYRRAMLDIVRVGDEVFDSDFFSYIEDSDLNWRAQNLGWSCMYEPAAVAVHARGHATGRSEAIRHHAYANRYLMITKNETAANLLRDLPELVLYEAYRIAKAIVAERELLPGYGMALRLFGRALRKRRDVQARRRVSSAAVRAWFQPDDYLGRLIGRGLPPSSQPQPSEVAIVRRGESSADRGVGQ